ncbi:hypothetical protein ACIGHN_23670 [Acidovorax sp. NPDC077693]|uniref:hypothetical protein n=1 Tax=unclassified Acidovorax TaxID=2684926 RepID=UPI0037CB1E44
MSKIPEIVNSKLIDARYVRNYSNLVGNQLRMLGVTHELLQSFYEKYVGPFWSERIGCELLDIVEGADNISAMTLVCRDEFNFFSKYLVISQLAAGQVVVLDTHTDEVYEVDFEGGERMLMAGTLKPRWNSFEKFLMDYFF